MTSKALPGTQLPSFPVKRHVGMVRLPERSDYVWIIDPRQRLLKPGKVVTLSVEPSAKRR